MARHPDHVERADRPVGDEVAGAREPGVEPALETHLELDPGPAHVLDDLGGAGEVDRDRLLAERREPGVRARMDQVGVGGGRGRDHDRIDRDQQVLGGRHGARAGIGGDLLGSIGVDIGEHDRVHVGDRPQRDRVGLAHAADPDHADAHPVPDGPWTSVRAASPQRGTFQACRSVGAKWNVPTNGAYDRRRPMGCQTDVATGRSTMETIRLTTAGAIVRHLIAQRTELDGDEVACSPAFSRSSATATSRAWARPSRAPRDRLPDVAGPERAVDGHGGDRVREGEAAASDHGRHELDRAGGAEHGHRGGHRAREPPPRAPALRRHVREPRAGPGAPAGGAVRGSDRHGERRLPARDRYWDRIVHPAQLLQSLPPGRGDDARPRRLRAGLPGPAAGRPGGGVRLPGGLLRATGAPDPAARTGSGRADTRGRGPPGGGASAPDRRRRRPLLPRDGGARGVRRAARCSGRRDRRGQVVAPVGSSAVRRPDRGHRGAPRRTPSRPRPTWSARWAPGCRTSRPARGASSATSGSG